MCDPTMRGVRISSFGPQKANHGCMKPVPEDINRAFIGNALEFQQKHHDSLIGGISKLSVKGFICYRLSTPN